MTEGVTHKTRKYCAPEVARDAPRGRKSDVYSLGCIYLEILTVLTGNCVDDLEEHLGGVKVVLFHDSTKSNGSAGHRQDIRPDVSGKAGLTTEETFLRCVPSGTAAQESYNS